MANIYDAITRAEALRHRSFCGPRSAEIIGQLVQFLDRYESPDPAQTISLLSLQLGNAESDLARVRGLLQRHGRHDETCGYREALCSQPECGEIHSSKCTCGLADAQSTFPQSSSLVSPGAESADIGKLDSVDESCSVCAMPRAHFNHSKQPEIWGQHIFNRHSFVAGSAETGGEKADV